MWKTFHYKFYSLRENSIWILIINMCTVSRYIFQLSTKFTISTYLHTIQKIIKPRIYAIYKKFTLVKIIKINKKNKGETTQCELEQGRNHSERTGIRAKTLRCELGSGRNHPEPVGFFDFISLHFDMFEDLQLTGQYKGP